MQTVELLAGPDGVFVYKFITTDEYKKLRLHIYRYESGKLSDQDKVEMGFEDIGSPKSGEIVMVPDFDNYVIKSIISGGGAQTALAAAGIKLFGGVSGDADKAVEAFINETLDYNPDVKCSHHEHNHGEGHTCGEHGCGSHSCH